MAEGATFEVEDGGTPDDEDNGAPWYRKTWVKYLAVLLVGIVIGTGMAGDTDTSTESSPAAQEVEDLQAENDDLRAQVEAMESEVESLQEELEEERNDGDTDNGSSDSSGSGDTDDNTQTEDTNTTNSEEDQTTAEGDFSDGTHRVGDDIDPDRYRAQPTGHCYWERLDGFSGELEDIKANGNHDGYHVIVDILAEDEGFKSEDCGWWTSTLDPLKNPTEERDDGMWLVGDEIKPGEWQAPAGEYCYWERLSGFTHELEDIEANGNPRDSVIVEIQDSDVGFHTSDCGTWVYAG